MEPAKQTPRTTKAVVVTSVMLSLISFRRAAAIVLNDLGSSAFYAGGIAEHAVGRAAPWFIFCVMRFRKAWVNLRDQPRHQVCFRIIDPDGSTHDFPI